MNERTEIVEGTTRLLVPEDHSAGGPGKRTGGVIFFNEQMAFNRDINVMFLRAFDQRMTVVDAMSATGARAVRIANEVPHSEVTANDINPGSSEYINANIELNELNNCKCAQKDLRVLLSEEGFDCVDLDPFGSPVPFTQSAIVGCRKNGLLAITATDTAPLAGAHRVKCERRYQSKPLRGPMCHEMGLRILMASVVKELAKFDRGAEPMLSFYADHYFRTYIRVKDGATNADKSLDKLIYVAYDPKTLERSYSFEKDKEHIYGPFWGGELHDNLHLKKMSTDEMHTEKRCTKMLDLWTNEIDSVPFIYDISEISSYLKISPPSMDVFIEQLNTVGKASRSHVSPTSFKTDLELKDIISAYIDTPRRNSTE